MNEIGIQELRKIQLEILKRTAEFCDQNSIRYFLCGGTLLGAIRHQGYIPWDDDIDIMLPRPDYERLISEFEIDGLEICTYRQTKNYLWPFVKISDPNTRLLSAGKIIDNIGVNIDAFPIDGFPTDSKKLNLQIRKIAHLRTIYNYWRWNQPILNNNLGWKPKLEILFTKGIKLFFSFEKLLAYIDRMGGKYKFNNSEKAGIAIWGYGIKEVCPQKVFTEKTDVLFENIYFSAPKDYHTYLCCVYGDYMKLPPEEERQIHKTVSYLK